MTVRIDQIKDREPSSCIPTCTHPCIQVRIDQMKDREPVSIQDGHQWGDGWLLVKRNEVEAAVENRPLYTVNSRQQSVIFRLLCIWKRLPEDEVDDNSHFEELELLRIQQETAGTL